MDSFRVRPLGAGSREGRTHDEQGFLGGGAKVVIIMLFTHNQASDSPYRPTNPGFQLPFLLSLSIKELGSYGLLIRQLHKE